MAPNKAQDIVNIIIRYVKGHPLHFYAGIVLIVLLFILFLFVIKPKKKKGKRTPLVADTKLKYKRIAVIGFLVLLLSSIAGLILFDRKYHVIENPLISKSEYVFGIDISHYQGIISWDQVTESKHPIKYVFVRATMGEDGKDKRYKRNWTKAKEKGYLRGAYHYYRPHENSTLQFNNFAHSVKLEKGDFPPVLDIEVESKHGTANLRRGVLNWLKLAEEMYKVKPILYTGRSFYDSYLKGHVKEYPLWIASYSGKHKLRGINWTMHQFTEEVKVKGIPEMVDGNDFNGTLEELKELGIK